jgi:hypothetical protein
MICWEAGFQVTAGNILDEEETSITQVRLGSFEEKTCPKKRPHNFAFILRILWEDYIELQVKGTSTTIRMQF